MHQGDDIVSDAHDQELHIPLWFLEEDSDDTRHMQGSDAPADLPYLAPPPPLDQKRSPSPTLDQHRSLSLPPDQHRLPPTLGQHRSLSLPQSLLLRAVRLLGLCTLHLHRTLDQLPFALIGVPATAASGTTLPSAASAATPISTASAATPVSAASASFAVAAIAVEPLVSRRHRASPVS